MWHYTSSLHLLWLASLRGQSHVIKSSRCLFHTGVSRVFKIGCVRGEVILGIPQAQVEELSLAGRQGRGMSGPLALLTPQGGREAEEEKDALELWGPPFWGWGGSWEGADPLSAAGWSPVIRPAPALPHSPRTAAEGRPWHCAQDVPWLHSGGRHHQGAHPRVSTHISGCCSDTLNSLGRSQVHIQSIQSCCQTVCPNSWFSKVTTLSASQGKTTGRHFPSAGLQNTPGFWFPLKGLTSTSLPVGCWWVPGGMWALEVGGPDTGLARAPGGSAWMCPSESPAMERLEKSWGRTK